jgi:hypothetical protein
MGFNLNDSVESKSFSKMYQQNVKNNEKKCLKISSEAFISNLSSIQHIQHIQQFHL